MEKRVWKGRILPGKLDTYITRHQQIWPEMTEALNAQGIHNYSIWNYGNEVIGYYECESLAYADKIKAESEVCRKWAESMNGILVMDTEPKSDSPKCFRQIFFHQ